MAEARQFLSHLEDASRIDFGDGNVITIMAFCDNFPPRIDDQRMAIGVALAPVVSVLSRRQHVALTLDRTCPQHHVPVRGAGCCCESRRNRQCDRTEIHQTLIQVCKAQVVAHAQPQSAEGHLGGDRLVTGQGASRLSKLCSIAQRYVEEMDFPISGAYGPIRPYVHTRVVAFVWIVGVLVKPAEHEIAELAGGYLTAVFEDRAAAGMGFGRQVLQNSAFDLLSNIFVNNSDGYRF